MKNLTLAFLLSLIGLSSSFAQVNLDSGLVAKYYFNGNANDESGNGNDGTVNGATLTNDRFGNANKAYSFDGSTNYIQCNTIPILDSTFTYSAWIKVTRPASDGDINNNFGCFGTAGSGVSLWNWGYNVNTQRFWIHDQTNGASDYLTAIGTNWKHVIIVFNGTQRFMYLDGSLVFSQSITTPIASLPTDFLRIGAHTNAVVQQFQGSIDDVRLYNRALTPEEITELYYEGAPTPPTAQSTSRCGSGSVTLTASGATGSETYKWFASVTDTTVLATGASFTTPFLTQTDTFYVCIDSAGYESAMVITIATVRNECNAKILFDRYLSNNWDIFMANTDGTEEINLSNNLYNDYNPRINPTVTKIAFLSNRSGQQQLYTMNLDGTNQTLVSSRVIEGYVDWTTDGKIIFSGGTNLYKINDDGTNEVQIATAPGGKNFTEINCSPVSNILTATVIGSWGYDRTIYKMNTDGSDMTILVADSPGGTFNSSFFPDGSKICYAYDISGFEDGSGRQNNDHLFFISINGTGNTDISAFKPANTNDKNPVFSYNGFKIFFCNNPSDESARPDIWSMNPDGSGRIMVIPNGSDPDYFEIFSVTPPTTQNASRCGSGSVTLTASGADSTETYKWFASATDTTVLATTASYATPILSQTDTFYVCIDSAGYESARVPAVATIRNDCAEKIVFTRQASSNKDIWFTNPDGTETSPLIEWAGSQEFDPVLSPDGTKLAFISSKNGNYQVWLANSNGSNPVQVTNSYEYHSGLCWKPDNLHLIYAVSITSTNTDIYSIKIDGTELTPLRNGGTYEYSPNIDPVDGRYLLYKFDAGTWGPTAHTRKYDISLNSETTIVNCATDSTYGSHRNTWSHNAQKVVFTRDIGNGYPNYGGPTNIYTMNPDGSGFHKLTNMTGYGNNYEYPGWSPDDQKILFVYNISYVYTNKLYFINSDGTGTINEVTLPLVGEVFQPNWGIIKLCQPISSTATASICQGQSYTVGTNTYTTSGTYTDTLQTSLGCDSIITTNLTINPIYSISESVAICSGQTYTLPDNSTVSVAGSYPVTLQSINGCDSVITTNLTVNPVYSISESVAICSGQSYIFNGHTYTIAGTYSDTLFSANNCDSIIVTDLTIKQPTSGNQTFVECLGFSVTVGSNTYNTTGIYTDVLTGSNGCDSTVTTDLTIKQPTSGNQTFVECLGFSVTVGSNTYNTTGIYTDVLTSVINGCDSTVTTDLTIKQPSSSNQTFVECLGFSVTVGSNTYSTTGIYNDTLQTINGCDSIIVTNLTVNSIYTSNNPVSICQGQNYSFNGHTYSTTGIYNDTLQTINGCDSIITTNLTVIPLPVVNLGNDTTICANAPITLTATGGTSYNWSNGINNPVNPVNPVSTTTYTVTVTNAYGCIASDNITVSMYSPINITVNTVNTACGQQNGIATTFVTGGTSPYNYLWNMGDTTNTASNLNAGVYIVYITDANNCQNSALGVVSTNNGPVIANTPQVTPVSCFGGSDGAISITVTGGMQPYEFEWSNGDTINQNISNLTAGPYEIIVTDANNCQAVRSINVTQPTQITVTISSVNATCGNADGTATSVVTGGTIPYTYNWSNGNTTANSQQLTANSYILTVTDLNSCAAITTAIITESGSATVTVDSIRNPICSGNNGKIFISVSGGSSYTYDWSDGSHNEDLTGVPAGTYSVTVSNGTGCNAVIGASLVNIVPIQQPICIITTNGTNNEDNKNMDIWEKQQTEGISHYKLYKETTQANVFHNIASVSYESMSTYTDQLSNPHSRAYRYKISAVDSCGNESQLSSVHKTIHLVVSLGQGNNINLIWNHYEGFTFDSYFIYRKCLGTPWEIIDTLPGNLNTFTNNPPCSNVNVKYKVGAVRGYECWASDNAKELSGPFSQSLSNIEDNGIIEPVNIQEIKSDELNCKIYPNPVKNELTIELSNPKSQGHPELVEGLNPTLPASRQEFEILNVIGQSIYSSTIQQKTTVNMSQFSSGVYIVKLNNEKSTIIKRFVKE